PARTDVSATPPRLRPKGPVGPDFRRQFPAAAGTPKQSAVERLEADKAKYVKSQVALSKQLPARPPARSLADGLQPTRKAAAPAKPRTEGVQLDVKHLTNLISNVGDGAQSGSASEAAERPRPPPRPDWSSPAKVRLKVPAAPRVASNGVPGPPAAGTVRRVDVLPPASPARTPCRPPLLLRKPLHPISLSPQFQLRPTASRLHPSHPRTPGPSPLKPVVVAEPSKPEKPPADPPERAAPAPPLPPSSPARTRLSSSSSRKRPSLTRSKSDLSDRCSRAGTELERFFNLCGLDPADLQERARSTSDIVSMVQFHSVSAPGVRVWGLQQRQRRR
ncbi:unnamed protein product, partial [Tetraodon nigroviridis]